MSAATVEEPSGSRVQAVIAVLVSFLGLGLGQLYAGWPRRALAVLVASVVLLAAWGSLAASGPPAFAVLVVAAVALVLAVLVDSARCGYRHRLLHRSRAVRVALGVLYVLVANLLLSYEALLIRNAWVEPFVIPAGSVDMIPTLLPGDYFLLDHRAFVEQAPRVGDVVVVTWPHIGDASLVRRVAALPGDAVVHDAASKRILVNGKAIYGSATDFGFEPGSVDSGNYFLLCDDLGCSRDSRMDGDAPRELIHGRAIFIYFSRDPATSEVRWDRMGRLIE